VYKIYILLLYSRLCLGSCTRSLLVVRCEINFYPPRVDTPNDLFPVAHIFDSTTGHAAARHLWKKYSVLADGLVFMVDA